MPDPIAPEKVIINGVEYDPGDAQQLIELGSKTRDFEKQFNTNIEGVTKIMPDYTRGQQELASLKKEKAEYETKLKAFESQARNAETPNEKKKALQAARDLGLLDDESASKKYLTREEAEQLYSTKRREEQDSQQILDLGKRFQSEITGEDGRMGYNAKAVLAYANTYGFFDGKRSYEQSLKDAYEEMAGSQNDKWKQAQVDAAKKPGLQTLKSGGIKQPPERKVDNLEEAKTALNELLWGGSE